MLAYLVIREGSNWTDVFRLVPGQTVTVGRAPTNLVILKDDRCSRHHAELFNSGGKWVIRDLESRNGTLVNGEPVRGDHILEPGEHVRIGHSHLIFVHDISKAFPDSGSAFRTGMMATGRLDDTTDGLRESGQVLLDREPTTITHRRGQTKLLEPEALPDTSGTMPKLGRAAAQLARLAFGLAKSPNAKTLAKMTLDGLFDSTQVDQGAVLLIPRDFVGEPTGKELEIVASRSDGVHAYQRISNFLAATVMREGEAVLARNVMGDSHLGTRDSQGEILALSVICAPIRRGERIMGLIHLASTSPQRAPDPDDLEFTLAVAETVGVALENLSQRQELAENLNQIRDENLQLREQLGAQCEIIGSSVSMQQVSREINRAAPNKATVLIRGESGVGKELVARAVHFCSPRKKGPFVCLNCAALAESLLESELFGHERGAFTGATERKIGKFEASHGGTLMLDEIGEMSLNIQAKFLRVLEGHPFERVGGSEQIKVDVRVIAATNRDLEKAVAEAEFRRDLYFRLRVLEITVPPLRKRIEDLPELTHYFLQRYNLETGRKIGGFSPEALDALMQYRWPGNIRELKNVIERAVVLARGEQIELEDLALTKLSTAGDTNEPTIPGQPADFEFMSLDDMERRHILATLRATNWNKSQSATILGIERSTLDRKIRRYELEGQIPKKGLM
ncbi:MAG: sigma 54-interacting transcriptional regulator [Pirellulales bacterium]|nr:sigma 54-interacting transcriptional regulator [Pirellulales bacterium]